MFHVFQSNSMHVLVDQFVHRTTARSLNPFQAQTVVVQSFGMGQWLKIRQAEQHGIAANMQCILPANLVWQLYRSLLTDLNLPIDSPFSIERMTWHLVQLLPQFNDSSFAGVRHFLAGSGDPQIRHYQLAEKIATLFDQYLIYRPDWILGWETDSPRADIPASWQKDLWRALNQTPQLRARHHRARLHRALLARLEQLSALPDDLPQQVSVIGLSSLPRIHLDTLQALSRHIDVDLYFLNPCQHYWGDIVSEKDLARRSIRQLLGKDSALADDDYLTIGNPLLSSLGKQGREYLELLLETEAVDTFDHFAPPAGNLMLARVKRDLLQLEFGGQFGSDVEPERTSVEPADLSIQIHVCHSKLREVEVLFDQLLRIIDRTPHITPADIIVMMPDVSDYAPFIEAVFPRDTMPYTIADRKPGQESAVLVALTALLSLPESRLTSIEVMDLLEVPIISRRLGLTEDDLLTLSRWIADSGIRWELDGPSKSTHWQLPAVAQNTWQFGLDRLLLGYAMDADAGLVHAILPLPVAADEGSLLGTLCHFVDLLATWRAHLAEPRAATDWRATGRQR
jgi:exodeoxyribonuclease V gamma subunit